MDLFSALKSGLKGLGGQLNIPSVKPLISDAISKFIDPSVFKKEEPLKGLFVKDEGVSGEVADVSRRALENALWSLDQSVVDTVTMLGDYLQPKTKEEKEQYNYNYYKKMYGEEAAENYKNSSYTQLGAFSMPELKDDSDVSQKIKKGLLDLGIGKVYETVQREELSQYLTQKQKEVMMPLFDKDPKLSNWKEYLYTIEAGGISLAQAIGVTLLTGSPTIGAGFLSWMEASGSYREAKDAGLTSKAARDVFALTGLGTFMLEKVGLDFLFSNIGGGRIAHAVLSSGFETLQEETQTIWQNLVKKHSYNESQDIFEGWYETIVGIAPVSFVAGLFIPGGGNIDSRTQQLISEISNQANVDPQTAQRFISQGKRTVVQIKEEALESLRTPGFTKKNATERDLLREFEQKKSVSVTFKETKPLTVEQIPKELKPLAKEALKYKTAEEFVAENDLLFQGVGPGMKTEFYTNDFDTARAYAEKATFKGKGEINVIKYGDLSEDAKVISSETLDQMFSGKLLEDFRSGKYDKFLDRPLSKKEYFKFTNEITSGTKDIKPIGKLKPTKSQLTDFYNQVTSLSKLEMYSYLREPEILKKKPSPFVRKKETTLLKDKFKHIAQGIRKGKIIEKKEIKTIQNELIDIIESSDLSLNDKGKFIRTVKNIQTVDQLRNALPEIQSRIEVLETKSLKRSLVKEIDKELKYTKFIKKGQQRVGKYDYESNKFFIKLRNYNRLNQERALNRLNEMPTEGLSEIDKIITRFLSYKVNGDKSSLTLQEQVLADIIEMKRIGEETKDEADFIKKLEKQQKIEEVLSEINKQKESKWFLKKPKTLYISTVANLYSTINAIAGKDIADKYDYGFYQTNSQDDFNRKIESIKEEVKKIYGVEKDRELNKIFLNELVPTDFTLTNEDGFSENISKFDLINIYNGIKNELVEKRYYNHFGEEQITSLLQNLSLEDVKLADRLMKEVQGYREILNKRSIEISGRDLGMVENYWPAKSEYQAEFFDDIKIQGETPSAMKERSKSSTLVPEKANAWLVSQRHIAQAEHVKTLSKKYEELKRIFSDGRVKKTIIKKHGDKVYYALMDHINVFSLNKRTQILDVFSNGYNMALNNWVKAKVASPTVFARQMISSFYSVEVVGIKNFLKYHIEAVQHPKKAFSFMWNNVPFIEARFKRGYSEALQDVIRGTNNLKIGMDGITKYTTLMVRSGDVGAIAINGYPIIKTELAKGRTMEQAIETFQKFTEKTQQSGTLANLSSLQRQRNAFARTFLRFKNTLNQLLRLQVDANIQFANKQISAEAFAQKTMLYSVYTPMMYVLIGFIITQGFKRLFGEEDEEKEEGLLGDLLQQIIIQPFQAIPLLDAAAETAYSEIRKRITGKTYYYGKGLFSFPLLDDVSTAFSKLTKKEPTAEDFLRVISLIQEPLTGVPTETILRYIRYSSDDKKKQKGGGAFKGSKVGVPDIKVPKIKVPKIKMPKIKFK